MGRLWIRVSEAHQDHRGFCEDVPQLSAGASPTARGADGRHMTLVVIRPPLAVALPSSACKLELNMPRRVRQILFIVSILWISWLAMMLVHESGHVLGAVFTGGRVRRVVWHPAVISRTDVRPNPHPLIEVWAGPVVGSVVPLAVAVLASVIRLRVAHVLWVVAGFCLIATGAYIGICAGRPVGQ